MHFASFSHLNPEHLPLFQARQMDELALIRALEAELQDCSAHTQIATLARKLIDTIRHQRGRILGIEQLLMAYPIATPAGQGLLLLAEALLRIDDPATKRQLVREVLSSHDWHPASIPINSRAMQQLNYALKMGAKLCHWPVAASIFTLLGEQLLSWLSRSFIYSRTILDALESSDSDLRYSYDMLGESALNEDDAERYFAAYNTAIQHTGLAAQGVGPWQGPGISIKLSALHPHLDRLHLSHLQTDLYPRLLELARYAKRHDIGLTIDAEEYERSTVTLAFFEKLAHETELAGWEGLGITVQAYHKQSPALIEHLSAVAHSSRRKIMLRLVKGAYWNQEIRRTQMLGLPHYPVFTQKAHTDLAYLACARRVLAAGHWFFPQFATHNPHTLACIEFMAGEREVEFQSLYGMGEALRDSCRQAGITRPWRIYAPIGEKHILLPYLMRRLQENGANTSFMHQLFSYPHEELVSWPQVQAPLAATPSTHGFEWADESEVAHLEKTINEAQHYLAAGQDDRGKQVRTIVNPANPSEIVGHITESSTEEIDEALNQSVNCLDRWKSTSIALRIEMLEKTACLLEARRGEFMLLLARETGKTLSSAINEWRIAIDCCRHYADEISRIRSAPLPSPLGCLVVITHWHTPLASLISQVCAALAVGNCVIVKPAQALITARAIRCMHEAGIPTDAVRMLTGGEDLGIALACDPRCQGVLFAGALKSAQQLRQRLAKHNPAAQFIVQTDSPNLLLADNSVHQASAVRDIMHAAFASSGPQRLHVLCVPEEIADELTDLLKIAMDELHLGDPLRLGTDIGPLVSSRAQLNALNELEQLREAGLEVWQAQQHVPQNGFFLQPALVKIRDPGQINPEISGPILGVLSYRSRRLERLLEQIKALGDTVTLGIYTRSKSFQDHVTASVPAQNIHLNRFPSPDAGTRCTGSWYLWQLVQDMDSCQYAGNEALPASLQKMAETWPGIEQSAHLFKHFFDYAERTPLGQNTSDRQIFRGRGMVACMGPGPEAMAKQACAALVTGNTIAVPANAGSQSIAGALDKLSVQQLRNPLSQPDLTAVLYEGEDWEKLEEVLAERNGRLVPLIRPLTNGRYPLFRLVCECTATCN